MGFEEATRTCFPKYATFSGRASRSEFWKFAFFLLICSFIATLVNSALFGATIENSIEVSLDTQGNQTVDQVSTRTYDGGWIGAVVFFATLLPLLAVATRRQHDRNKSGWWLLLPIPSWAIMFATIYFTSTAVQVDPADLPQNFADAPTTVQVPSSPTVFLFAWLLGVGSIILVIVWLARSGTKGENFYGPPSL